MSQQLSHCGNDNNSHVVWNYSDLLYIYNSLFLFVVVKFGCKIFLFTGKIGEKFGKGKKRRFISIL